MNDTTNPEKPSAALVAEASAFFAAVDTCPPGSTTSCHGWTAHEIVAHLTAAALEVSLTLEAHNEGRPVPATRGFEEREAPYRAMEDGRLRRELPRCLDRVGKALDAVLIAQPDAVVPWTGRQMVVRTFIPHVRSELTLHRWDLVGDDDTGTVLLAQEALTDHAVVVLGRALVARGAQSVDHELRITIGAENTDNVVAIIDSDGARLERASTNGEPAVDADPAARLLLLWGRRPADPRRINALGGAHSLTQLQDLLAGY